jgi:phosphotransacetylase
MAVTSENADGQLHFPKSPGDHLSVISVFSVLSAMKPATDYIRHAAKLARKLQMDAAMGGTLQPDAEFYKALSKALDEIAAGLEQVSRSE